MWMLCMIKYENEKMIYLSIHTTELNAKEDIESKLEEGYDSWRLTFCE